MDDNYFKELEREFDDSPPATEEEEVVTEEETPEVAEESTGVEQEGAEESEEAESTEDSESSHESEDDEPEATEPPIQEEAPQYATKDDVVAALREYNQEQAQRQDILTAVSEEILDKLYPDVRDTKLYDEDGNEVKGIEDLADRLIDPNTGELFTEEGAARWIMESQQQVNRNLEEARKYSEEIAATNISLKEGYEMVNEKWGDVLAALPEGVAQDIESAFISTLIKDETTGIATKAPVDIVQFYDIALRGYRDLANVLSEREAAEAEAKKKQAEAERDERVGLGVRGTSKTKANTGDDNLDALLDAINE